MPFPFFQRGSLSDHARQFSLTSYEPSLVLEGLVPGIDNLRYDVFLSPKFTTVARQHIFKLIVKHGGIEDLAAEAPNHNPQARFLPQQAAPKRCDPGEFRRLLAELHVASLNRAKLENNVSLDLLFRLAVLKFQRTELLSQYGLILERCRARVKTYESAPQTALNRGMHVRERVARFQIDKKIILRRAGQDLFNTLRDTEKETLGKTRRSLLGDAAALAYELFLNRLLFTEDGRDYHLNAEHYVMLGNYDRDSDRFETMQELAARLFKLLELANGPEDPLVEGLLNVPDNAQEMMAGGSPDEATARGKAQKAVLNAWVELLEESGVMESVVAAYEVAPLLPQYSPPINPHQLKNALISREEQRRVEDMLEEHGKISPDSLHAAIRKVSGTRPAERARFAGRFFADFTRYHRDLRRMEAAVAAFDTVNVLATEKFRELSAVNNTLYEFLLPQEQKPVEEKVLNHVVIKADIRESTTVTRTLFERGLNPASYFSLNFYEPINKLLPKYDARKVFIEGDAIILALFEREDGSALGVAQACVLAKEIVEIVNAHNQRSLACGLPGLELGIGISFQDSAPMYLMDGPRQIMISKAINESDRLSSCHKGIRRLLEKRDLLFNVFSFKTMDDSESGGNPEEFLQRYNIGGIHISAAAFNKLCTEISLQEFDLKVPLIWKTSKVRVYTGMVPLGQGMFHRIAIREGNVAQVSARDFSLKQMTDQPYYEVCVNPKIYAALETSQTAAMTAR
ncbi:MAG TPA: hypothetical protein VJN64_15925 [Terriglobales bacterium]|nr:hypothetical protein [Terriglobales bacterium]